MTVKDVMSKAIEDVTAERLRQQSVEGWTPEHDDEHDDGSLAMAAVCYAEHANADHWVCSYCQDEDRKIPERWPWDPKWWKPTNNDARRDLVKAAALLVAEIERLDRAVERNARSLAVDDGRQGIAS